MSLTENLLHLSIDQESKLALLQILEDRYGKTSTVITAQLPVGKWHEYLANPMLADAILDRLVHQAHRIELKEESLRKSRSAGRESLK